MQGVIPQQRGEKSDFSLLHTARVQQLVGWQGKHTKPQSCSDFQPGPGENSKWGFMVLINVINSALSQLKHHQGDHFRSRSDFTTVKLLSEHVKC